MEDKERVVLPQKKWPNNLFFLIFCTSLHTLVNKYVLSVLKFQYPTLFISWQCGICVVLLMSAHVFGYTKLSSIDNFMLKMWLPSMVLHTGVMYFGSVSLSKLAIPIFIGLQNLTYLCIEFLNFWKSKLLSTITVQISLVVIGFGALYIFYSIFKTNPVAHKWISAYILFLGLYTIYLEIVNNTKLSGMDRIFYNSLFCLISLTVLSIITREWVKFFEFPFRHHGRFILSCVCSGILYCLAAVLPLTLTKETSSELLEAGMTSGRVLVSTISAVLFEATLNAPSAFSVMMLLFGGMVYTFSKIKQNILEER